jgi:tetratricopeptide (TPR) repeat protein
LAIDRAEAVKKAEKLLRQGKLDLAIAEYQRIVDEQPRDWNTRNTLGDLYVRASQPQKAVAHYEQVADHLYTDGFFAKAAALYKKILKFKPDEESVQLHLADISAKQGLLADARAYFNAVAKRRKQRGDKAGADEIVIRLGTLDPADFDARGLAAQTLANTGDRVGAAAMFRSMHTDLVEKGRADEAQKALAQAVRLNPDDVDGRAMLAKQAIASGDQEGAQQYLDRTIAGNDPSLLLPLLEMELRRGRLDSARELLPHVLSVDAGLRDKIIELAWTLAPQSPEAAFVCIDAAVGGELAVHNYMDAAALLQEFVTRVPDQIDALLKLVEICVDGGLEAVMYEAQAHLADAWLERGNGTEARVIAEDLVAREPWEQAHIERFRRALVMLEVEDPDAIIAERLSGQGPFVATDPFMAPEDLGEPDPVLDLATREREAVAEVHAELPAERDIPLRTREPEPDIPLRPRKPAGQKDHGVELDLTSALSNLEDDLEPKQNLDAVFSDFRSELSKQTDASEAGEYLVLAKTYLDMGMSDEAIDALKTAARAPVHRFEAASLLGRLFLKQDDLPQAVEWLERAAGAPAPGINEGRELLYDLGSSLEAAGETSRALAAFLELQNTAGDYRDVPARIERLARVQAGG